MLLLRGKGCCLGGEGGARCREDPHHLAFPVFTDGGGLSPAPPPPIAAVAQGSTPRPLQGNLTFRTAMEPGGEQGTT